MLEFAKRLLNRLLNLNWLERLEKGVTICEHLAKMALAILKCVLVVITIYGMLTGRLSLDNL